ncbi:hypothetical protein FLA_4037 [Filimonas lacunae]|nr:hypothetical protein FLA_4037 [Filimonas lacunae]
MAISSPLITYKLRPVLELASGFTVAVIVTGSRLLAGSWAFAQSTLSIPAATGKAILENIICITIFLTMAGKNAPIMNTSKKEPVLIAQSGSLLLGT